MATGRPLVNVFKTDGTSAEQTELPGVFLTPIRPDLVHAVHTSVSKNKRQPYAVSKKAGMQVAAESWGTGRAVSRIPRVPGSGTHRAGEGAFGNMCRGGRMFAPTKTWRKWHRRTNVNERRYAVASALAASAIPALLMARGHRVNNLQEVPLVMDGLEGITKVQEAIEALRAVGAYDDVEKAKASRKVRAGKGKARNRRYVMRRGPLIVYDGKSSFERAFRNLPGVECCKVENLSVLNLAPGSHLGRFCVWTKQAFDRLESLWGSTDDSSKEKTGYHLPRPIMRNADLAAIINSSAVQEAIRPAKEAAGPAPKKTNPLRNRAEMVRLNPYAAERRREAEEASKNRDATRQARIAKIRSRKQFRAGSLSFLRSLQSEEWTRGGQ